MALPRKRPLALLCAPLLALGVSACAKTVSTSSYKGEQKDVAQTIANLQSDVTAGDESKVCSRDLASAIVAKLKAAKGGCKQAVKNQLAEIDSFDVTVESVTLGGSAARRTATARVKSVYAGKTRPSTLSLLKEGGKWRISGLS